MTVQPSFNLCLFNVIISVGTININNKFNLKSSLTYVNGTVFDGNYKIKTLNFIWTNRRANIFLSIICKSCLTRDPVYVYQVFFYVSEPGSALNISSTVIICINGYFCTNDLFHITGIEEIFSTHTYTYM